MNDNIGELNQALASLPDDIFNTQDEKLEVLTTPSQVLAVKDAASITNGNGKVHYTDGDIIMKSQYTGWE